MSARRTLQGRGAVAGLAIGPTALYQPPQPVTYPSRIEPEQVAAEQEWLQSALTAASDELEAVSNDVRERLGEEQAAIFTAQQLMLSDPELVDAAMERIAALQPAAAAVSAAAAEVSAMLAALDDEYLRERATDVREVAQRVVRLLHPESQPQLNLSQPSILLAAELEAGQLVSLPRNLLLGIALAGGGITAHVAILCRSLALPLIVGLGEVPGDAAYAVLDGGSGTLILNPNRTEIKRYQDQLLVQQQRAAKLATLRDRPAATRDGQTIRLVGNAAAVQDSVAIVAAGGEGIGLLRTEFLFGDRELSEDEQVAAYGAIMAALPGKEIVIRTLDLGGDKPPAWLPFPAEANPFLGWRGLRVGLERGDLLATQLRAILRAAAGRKVSIMFPMVTTLEELRLARTAVEQAATTVGGQHNAEVGIMVEVPAAVLLADVLAQEADFFSIGTNDLTQYVLAADRGNPHVAALYNPRQPAVIRAVAQVVAAAHGAGRWVGICGEAAGDPALTPLWLGLGLDELSMAAPSLLPVKAAVREADAASCRELAAAILRARTLAEVDALLGGGPQLANFQ